MARRGAPHKQPRIIHFLEEIGSSHGYKIQMKGQDSNYKKGDKRFFPDIHATPKTGTKRRFFEVEATVTNNTIYKSLGSLLQYLSNYENASAYLVVPQNKLTFARNCANDLIRTIRSFGKKGRGANPKIRLEVTGFEDVARHYAKVGQWEKNDRIGQPPKCPYLPR